jgi:arylformamidase
MKPYRGMSREELDREYRVIARIPDPRSVMSRITTESERFRQQHAGLLDLRFGATVAEALDLFIPPCSIRRAPVHLFVHGGYWYQFPKAHWSVMARGLTEAGILVAVCDYSLCPVVTVTEITRQIRAAVAWLYTNIAAYGGDPGRIHLSGHSVGGQLATMAALAPWADTYGIPQDVVKSVLAISGVFDLRPVQQCYVQDFVKLSDQEVLTLAPHTNINRSGALLHCAVGDGETDEFVRQSVDFLAAWRDVGNEGEAEVLAGVNHLTILDQLIQPEGRLCQLALRLLRTPCAA